MNKKRYEELLTIIRTLPNGGAYPSGVAKLGQAISELRDLREERIVELEAEVAEVKREQGDKACPLVHCRCGACGVAIHDDGGCGCKDNRRHGIAVHEADRITKLTAEIARYRDALQQVADMHTSHYDNLARHVIDVQSIIDRSMTPDVDAETAEPDNADFVLMPRVLTDTPACHEFRTACVGNAVMHEVAVICAACNSSGREDGRKCVVCDGDGHALMKVYVTYPTIRKIYEMAVKHLGKETG